MTTRHVILLLLAAFLCLYAGAELTRVHPPADRVILRWATDPNPARRVQVGRFAEAWPGHEVTIESGAMEKLIVQCATGTGPDLIDIYSADQMAAYVNAGILLDLTPYAPALGFGLGNTYPALAGGLTFEGRQYRFPCNVSSNTAIINRRVLEDHGIELPAEGWTWDDFIKIAQRLKTPGRSGQTHIALTVWSKEWFVQDLLVGAGGRQYSPEGLASRFDTPQAITAMQLYHDLLYKHAVIPTPEVVASMSAQGGWGSAGIRWFTEERAAMIFIGRWYLNMLRDRPELGPHLHTMLVPAFPGQPSRSVIGGRGAGINAKSPRRDEAMKFLAYLASEPYNDLIINDGDGLPPNPAFARNGADLVNDLVPDPDFHQAFIDSAAAGQPLDVSPFVDAGQVSRWLRERIDRVENSPTLDVAETMRGLAREVNLRIRRNVAREGHLQRKFEEVTGQPYSAEALVRWQEDDQRRAAIAP